jgi:HD superfamily phosphohydrolase
LNNEFLQDYFKSKNYRSPLFDDYVQELVKIAGLCHDIGHGPFSHVFDDVFCKRKCKGKERPVDKHENRSNMMIRKIISSNEILKKNISDNCIKFIESLINPEMFPGKCESFVYGIISNDFNGIDVDKFDYISRDTYMLKLSYGFDHKRIIGNCRVLDNKICFPVQDQNDIYNMFRTRYMLHKQIYTHKVVLSTQYMINDILMLIDEHIEIYKSIEDIDKFIKLNDYYITQIVDNHEIFSVCKPEMVNTFKKAKKILDCYIMCYNRRIRD